MTTQDILTKLKEGNLRFIKNQLETVTFNKSSKSALAKGQSPFAVILSCADSRVVPELIFNTGIGELFVIRVAGNIANNSSLASMEYAVSQLGTPVIIVLGHQNCGAVTTAVQGGVSSPYLNHLLSHIFPAIKEVSDPTSVDEVIRKNTLLTVKKIRRKSKIIKKAINGGKVKIIPAYYHLESGLVEFIDY